MSKLTLIERMDVHSIVAALGNAINSFPRPLAFAGLARLKYPERELIPQELPDGTMSVRLAKYGWEYKHRGPRPKTPYPSNSAAVRDALAQFMPKGVTIQRVEDCGTYLQIYMEEL